MATSRFSRVSGARYTSPMPPAPAGATILYGPSFVPEARVIGACNYNPVRQAAVDATTLGDKSGKWWVGATHKMLFVPLFIDKSNW